jgi:hypothetical protein
MFQKLKMTIFWNFRPSFVEIYRRFRRSYCLHRRDYGGSKNLKRRSVCTRLHSVTFQKSSLYSGRFGNTGCTCLNIRTQPSCWYPVRKFERKENNKKKDRNS